VHVTCTCICSTILFFALWYFSLCMLSLFEQAAISLSFLPCNVSHSKQTGVMFSCLLYFPASSQISVYPLQWGKKVFWSISASPFLYIKPLFPIDKQFSIDSFSWLEGHHYDSRASRSSCHCSQFLPYIFTIATHLTN